MPNLKVKNVLPSLKRTNVLPSMRISSVLQTGPRQTISAGTPIGLLLTLTYAITTAGFLRSDSARPSVRISNI